MPVTSLSIALEHFTTFGDLLKYLRRRAGLTQRELSIAVGYSDTQISRLEQNERLPDLATISARFLPVLMLEDQPGVAARLLELAASVRREDAPAAGLPPYKGLYYFDESDSELFFGRETLTASLVDRLISRLDTDQRFLAVIGASGSGKSSLMRAGVIPALRWRPAASGWPVYILTPTAHPLEALAAQLNDHPASRQALQKLAADFATDPQGLQKILARLVANAGAAGVLLVVDQFEELFTLCRSESEQSAFIDGLLSAAFQPDGKAIILIVMRADFYAHCARFDRLRQALARQQEYIGPMSTEELRRAIEEPARRGHWEIEPGLVDLLLQDVGVQAGRGAEPGALPLLSHALLETWQRRRGQTLTLSGYSAAGGVRGAIAETAEAVFQDQLEPQQRLIARQIFLRLTELGGDDATADTRRRVNFDELISKPEEREAVQQVLLTLADARLITTEQDTAEVAHEALIREWPTLRNWLEADREGLRLHRHLTEAAQEWEAGRRDPGGLYRGARLFQALEWSNTHGGDLNQLEQDFLEASRALVEKENREREAQRQRELESARHLAETEKKRAEEQFRSNKRLHRRAVYLVIALLCAGTLALAAGIFGQRAVRAGRLAASRELAAAAINDLNVDAERSVLLSLQALSRANTLEASNALHQSLPELHLLHSIQAHNQAVGVAYSPDGKRLASVDALGGEAKVWDAATYKLLLTLPGEPANSAYDIAFSPDGKLLAIPMATQVVVWDASGGQKLFSLAGSLVDQNTTAMHLAFSPDGKRLAVANFDGTPKVFDLASRQVVLSLVGHAQACEGIAYSPDGKLLASGDLAGTIRIWDAASGQALHTLEQDGFIHSLAFSPDGTRLASVTDTGTLKIWDTATGSELLRLRAGLSGLYDVAFMPDGKRVITAGKDGSVRVLDVEFGQEVLSLTSSTSTVISVAASPDGKHIASSAYDGTLKIWDATPGRELLTLPAHQDVVWDVAYSPDGTRLASASQDGSLKLWEAATGALQQTLPADGSQADGYASIAFSPDGKWLAAGCLSGKVVLWDLATGQVRLTLSGHTANVVGIAFSPAGTRLATVSWDGIAKIWDLASGRELLTLNGPWFGIAFSPDGKSLFAANLDQSVHKFDAATGRELGRYSGEGKDVYALAISPDGKLLASSRQDGLVTLWDLASGEKVKTISASGAIVVRLAFSRDGTRLATASFDRLARVWDVRTGQELATLYGNGGDVFGVSFDPAGTRLATASADGTVRIYLLELDELVALARSRLTRSLTPGECQKYLHVKICPVYP